MVSDVLAHDRIAGELVAEFERVILAMRDVPGTVAAIRHLLGWLRDEQARAVGAGWRRCAELLRGHELGRLLRSDPMVRRCQWRPEGASPYALVEPFAWGWDDAVAAVSEAEEPGQTINAVLLATGLAAAMRERRMMVHPYLAAAARAGAGAAVLALGAGRAPETRLAAPDGPHRFAEWLAVDPAGSDDAVIRRQKASRVDRRTMPILDFLQAGRGRATFDLVYMVDALDGLDDRAAAPVIEAALQALRPNGRLLVSAFAPEMPEAGYMDAVLDWRPHFRDEAALGALLEGAAVDGPTGAATWRGGSERATFGVIERLSWTG